MNILAIATDYDGTLAENDVAPASTVAALERFKVSGRKLILVTGRHLPELKRVFGSLRLFDIAVLENGGLLYLPATGVVRPLAPAPSEAFVARLRQHGVDYIEVGQTIVATTADYQDAVRRTIDEMGANLEIILNTDALMVLPPGIDKASGLKAALAELALPAVAVAGIGDAENDIVFLKYCGYPVAVANALPQVKAIASLVTAGARGAGVEEFIAAVLAETEDAARA